MIGFLNINKPSGVSSNFIVQKIKKKFRINKIGHLGTLDPLASGVLPIAIGKATRMFDYSLDKTKRYTAIFDFGYTTDTLDTTGEIISRTNIIPNINDISSALTKLTGKISQIPPNFSAKNINGSRAYDLARKGIEFELKPKNVIIHSIKLLEQISDYQFKFDIICSSGTYIRSIARDLGQMVGSLACMSYLNRTETGVFTLDSAIDFNDLMDNYDNIDSLLISIEHAFPHFDIIEINEEMFNDLINGKRPKYDKIINDTFIVFNNKVVGVAKKGIDTLCLDAFLY